MIDKSREGELRQWLGLGMREKEWKVPKPWSMRFP
jgi:hypothetical protein